ncbi:stage V sporulation protein B [Bacillus massilinigeriensis]|uniref:stage V sporulation protein B n=1 Tax=Bacillus mediterraneensis TaxID=1805474 RepID=UPI0008F871CB|nr:stage V sporulation protein B [Bacillus mediterraneensis]
MSKFLKGTVILLIAGLVTRVLGFINRIVLARFIGEEGVGLYMMAFPTLILVVTITQLGLPVAISKHIAEAKANGDHAKIKKILTVSLALTISLSVIFTPTLILLAPYLSQHLFTDSRTLLPLLAIAPVIPITAVSSVLRGYFQGLQNMKPAALSQVMEQIVRIMLIAACTKTFLPYGVEYAAAAAMVSAIVGELAALAYIVAAFKIRKKFRLRRNFFGAVKSGKDVLEDLMSIAIPATGSRLIGSVSWFFEPIVVAQGLAIAGVATSIATRQYGALTGFAMPLLMLPSFITFSLSTALVPAISEANSKNNHALIEHRLQQSLRLSLVSGGIAVVLLYVLAEPLMLAMYGSESGSQFIRLMSPFFIFYYYQGPLQATLQALNLARAAMVNSLIGNVAKTATVFFLASQPAFGINGVALGITLGIVLVTLLHFATVLKVIPFTFAVREYAAAFTIIGLSLGGGFLLFDFIPEFFGLPWKIIFVAFPLTVVYFSLTIGTGLLKKEEVRRIPVFGKVLVKFSFFRNT